MTVTGGRRRLGRWRLALGAAALILVPLTGVSQTQAQEQHGTLRPITTDGLGNPDNVGFTRIYEFQGYLFTPARNFEEGVIVYRSRDGENWEAISPGGIDGDLANSSLATMAWFSGENDPPGSKGKLYVGTYAGGSGAQGSQDGSDIWRANADAENPDDIVWEKITKDAFGDPSRTSFVGFVVFKDHLYTGTFNTSNGSEVFRTTTGDPDDWHRVSAAAMGDPDHCTDDLHINIVFGDHVYFGTEEFLCLGRKGAEIWRTNGDDLVDGQTTMDGWEKVSDNGFGHTNNNNIFGMDVFKGHYYAATWGYGAGTEVWRAPVNLPHEGENPAPFEWEQVNLPGFGNRQNAWNVSTVHLGDTLYVAGLPEFAAGGSGYFYRTDGAESATEHLLSWTEITGDGFPNASTPFWLEVFKGKVYLVTVGGAQFTSTNPNAPGQIWVYEPTDVPVLSVTGVTDCVQAGGQVTIDGTGFDDYQGEAYPTLDGWPIDAARWTDTQIVAEIPPDATSGEIAVYRSGETSNGEAVRVVDASQECEASATGGSEPAGESSPLPATGGGLATLALLLALLPLGLWLYARPGPRRGEAGQT